MYVNVYKYMWQCKRGHRKSSFLLQKQFETTAILQHFQRKECPKNNNIKSPKDKERRRMRLYCTCIKSLEDNNNRTITFYSL